MTTKKLDTIYPQRSENNVHVCATLRCDRLQGKITAKLTLKAKASLPPPLACFSNA